jgi:hypothetical protein
VNELADTSTCHYAVISGRSEPAERLVIAYRDEEALRDLIAAPSILALGYTSRADALENIDSFVTTSACTTNACWKRLPKTASLFPNITFLTECRLALRRLTAGFARSGTAKIMRNLLHNALAAALIFFYSRNVFCTAARVFISH